ncbi:MAG: zinc ABC transporter substrate-binding protein [Clostridia bacterium]|nr:zinc ABC transporter substrate-binding protein [Clostridia bacterium]
MKKIIALAFCIVLIFTLSACGGSADNSEIKIVTTIFPVYDWVREIAGDNKNIDITMLLDSGADLHSFQPTAEDIIKISTCDMFIYVGGESDKWVNDALAEKQNKDMVAINLLDLLGEGKKQEEIKEGMEAEEEGGDSGEEKEAEYDEHIWLSLKNASLLCLKINDELCKIDKSGAEGYKTNAINYTQKLGNIDKQYELAVSNSSSKTLVFGDRFPFRYLADDYGLDYFAAFAGCSAESEASFETVVFLANKIDELGLNSIIKIEGSDGKLANTIKENTKSKNAQILTLDSMQSVTLKQVDSGVTYTGICEKNLDVLKIALG